MLNIKSYGFSLLFFPRKFELEFGLLFIIVNLMEISDEITFKPKPNVLRHSGCGTIKIPSCSRVIST